MPAAGERWYIQDLWVEPAYRRHGVASAMMGDIEAQARRASAPFLEAEVRVENPDAQKLMRRVGFQLVGTESIMTRRATYADFIHDYNCHRAHTAIGGLTPMQRVHNVTGKYRRSACLH
ncbi:hypothetical protein GCM10027595_19790 [Corynebacterium nasicanis]